MIEPLGRRALRRAERILALVGLFALLYTLAFDLSYMSSDSMAPTLQAGENPDWVLTEKISGWFGRPSRWDVLTFRDRDGFQLMKRVIALPGESISLPDVGMPLVNGAVLQPPPHLAGFRYLPAGNLANGAAHDVSDGCYVLGDEVRDSLDSRFEGAVPPQRMIGRAWLRLWPPSRFGRIR